MNRNWIVAGMLLLGSAAWADGHRGDGHRPDPEKMVERMSQKLQLNDTQRDQLESIMEEAQTERQRLREQMKAHRQETEGKIDAILTEEQRAELEEMREQRRQRMQERRRDRSERKN